MNASNQITHESAADLKAANKAARKAAKQAMQAMADSPGEGSNEAAQASGTPTAVSNLAARFASVQMTTNPRAPASEDEQSEDGAQPYKRIRKKDPATVVVESNTVPPEFLEPGITCKKIQIFHDFFVRSKLAGKEYGIADRQALIKKDAKKEIFYQFIIHKESCGLQNAEDWEEIPSEDLFPMLLKIFKTGHSEASVGDRLRKLIIKFKIQSGYSSLFDFLKKVDSLLEEYDASDPITPKQEEEYVRIMLDGIPKDPVHIRLKQLAEDLGKPKTFNDFREQLLKSAGRLHDSYNDMVACGLLSDKQAQDDIKRHVDKSKHKPQTQTQTEKTYEKITSDKLHRGCGRIHKGPCIYHKHPDYNGTDLDWSESPKGIAWAAKGENKLPHGKTLDLQAKWTPPIYEPTRSKRGRGEQYLYNIFNTMTDYQSNTIPCVLRSKGVTRPINVFIDTGALHGNYCSPDIADWLLDKGESFCHCVTEVCSPINNTCRIDRNNKSFAVHVLNETANFDFKFNATILDSQYDIIIGRPTIKEFNLLRIFDKYFLNEDELRLTNKKKTKLIHSRLATALKSSPPIDESASNSSAWISAQLAMATNGVQHIPIKNFLNRIPADDDEINFFHKKATWEVEIPDTDTTSVNN